MDNKRNNVVAVVAVGAFAAGDRLHAVTVVAAVGIRVIVDSMSVTLTLVLSLVSLINCCCCYC